MCLRSETVRYISSCSEACCPPAVYRPHAPHVQVMGLVGSARKRMLMLWQAVEMSRAMEAPDHVALALARAALEPPADPRSPERMDEKLVGRTPLATGIPRHWSIVRCGCIEGTPMVVACYQRIVSFPGLCRAVCKHAKQKCLVSR